MKKQTAEIARYLIIGILTTVVSLGSYYALVYTILDPTNPLLLQVANIISWIAAVTFAFFTNRKIVFKSENKNVVAEAIKFYASRLFSLVVEMACMFIMVTCFGMNDKISKIVVQVVVLILNYVTSKLIVFRNKDSKNIKS